jgi:hypothetical protein
MSDLKIPKHYILLFNSFANILLKIKFCDVKQKIHNILKKFLIFNNVINLLLLCIQLIHININNDMY